jgi:hypothetical protein
MPSVVVAPPRTFDENRIELGPAIATVGVTYPYDLYVHCGAAFAMFSGHGWVTEHSPGDPGPSPVGNGVMAYTGYLAGWMTLLDRSTAIFTFSGSTTPFVYRETTESIPLCD